MSSAPEKAAQCSAVLPSYRIQYERGFVCVGDQTHDIDRVHHEWVV